MTLLFWGIVALMVVIALALLVPPLLRPVTAHGPDRQALNVVVHRDRLAELEAERAEGSLSEEQFLLAQEELERELLADVAAVEQKVVQGGGRLPSLLLLLLLPLAAVALYMSLGVPQTIGVDAAHMASAAGDQPEMSVEEMVARLEERLKAQPDDPEGWVMLARSYRAIGNLPASAVAFGKAHELVGDGNPDLNANYAQALALANGNDLTGKPTQLLEKALAVAPEHEYVLWLSGIAAFQRGDFDAAIAHWEKVAGMLEPGSEDHQRALGFIAQAQQRKAGVAPEAQSGADGASGEAAAAPVALTVSVSLAPELAARAAPEDTLFVYARAAQGPRMPLALVRKQVKDLPLTVVLDDSNSMVQGAGLSQAHQVIVAARVSKSGNAMAQPGDLQGESAPLTLAGDAQVSVVIDRATP